MSESQDHIYRPPAPESDLIAVPNKYGETQYQALSLAELIREGSTLKEENQRRYEQLKQAPAFGEPTSVDAYLSKWGWVINLRNPETREDGLTMQAIERVRAALHDQVGKTASLSLDSMKSPWWGAAVRLLEADGFSVAAVTDGAPHGRFAAQLADGKLTGWEAPQTPITRLNITNTGIPMMSAAPEAPKYTEPGLHYTHVNNMAVAHYKEGEWSKTFVVPSSRIALQGANTTALQYAQSAFEGGVAKTDLESVEGIEGGDGVTAQLDDQGNVTLFRVEENAKRMTESVLAMGGPEMDPEQVRQSIMETVQCNLKYIKPGQNLYIRPYVIGTRGGAGANAAKEYIFAVEVWSFGDYFKSPKQGGIKLEGRRDRHRPATGADKVGPNYAPLFKAKKEAKERGYNDILSFDEDGNVEEVSSCAMYFIERGEDDKLTLITPVVRNDEPDSEKAKKRHSLNSITRRSVKDLAEALGIKVEIRDISHSEIPTLVGCFTVGSAAGITRVEEIDIKTSALDTNAVNCNFSDRKAIALTQQLYETLIAARTGTLTDPRLIKFNTWATKIPVSRGDLMPEKQVEVP